MGLLPRVLFTCRPKTHSHNAATLWTLLSGCQYTVTKGECKTLIRGFRNMAESSTCEDTFLYFGYGSNLLKERIQLQNKSASFKTTAILEDYQLEFNYQSPRWKGCVATITPAPGQHVWGVVWQLHKSDLPNLDDQEGVHTGIYKPIKALVTTESGVSLTCRSYQMTRPLEEDRRPSPQYKDVILRGARESKLPEDYIAKLTDIEHNGYSGDVNVLQSLS